MSKTSIQQFSTTAASNTDIDGINVNTGWPPSNVGPAFREMMALLASSLQLLALDVSAATSVTLTAPQASAQIINFTGALTANCTIVIPNATFIGWALNSTSGGFNIIISSGGGMSAILAPTNAITSYYCDGAGNCGLTNVGLGNINGPITIGAPVTFTGTPVPRFNSGLLVANNNSIYWLDVSGTPRPAMIMGADNYIDMVVSGGVGWRVLNQALTSVLINCDNNGNVTIASSLTVAGQTPIYNNGGTYGINITGSSGFATSASFATNATNASFATNATNATNASVAAVANSVDWSNVTSKPYIPNQNVDSGSQPTFAVVNVLNSVTLNASGWTLNPFGTSAFSGPFGVGLNASATNCLAFSYIAASDARIKTDVTRITAEEGERWVRTVHGRRYRKRGQWEAGHFAQDMLEVSPELIVEFNDPDMPAEMNGYSGPAGKMLEVNQGGSSAYLTAALASALDRIARLEALLGV